MPHEDANNKEDTLEHLCSSECDNDSAWEAPIVPTASMSAVKQRLDSKSARLWQAVAGWLRRLCWGEVEPPLETAGTLIHGGTDVAAPVTASADTKHKREQPFVLPHLWNMLKASADYEARVAEVAAFNAQSRWHFKGIAMTPCRYPMVPLAQPAGVSVYRDGSVVVAHAGIEMGQGLSTKVKQVAIYELSTLLHNGGGVPWQHVRTADNSSELLPNGPCTGGVLVGVGMRRDQIIMWTCVLHRINNI